MNINSIRSLAIALLGSASLVACGGGGDDRMLSSLSDDEVIAVCEDFSAGLTDGQIDGIVGFSCLISESFQTSCDQTRLDACITGGRSSWTGLECEAPAADDPIRSCDATVDELTDCFDAQYDQYADLGDAQCADLQTFNPSIPAACAPLQTKCPDFFQ